MGTDIDGVDDAIEQLKTKQGMLETLADELEKKDEAMEKTMKEIKDNGSELDEKIKDIMNNAWFDWTHWTEWSACVNGEKSRTRECPGVNCLGEGTNIEVEDCQVIDLMPNKGKYQ